MPFLRPLESFVPMTINTYKIQEVLCVSVPSGHERKEREVSYVMSAERCGLEGWDRRYIITDLKISKNGCLVIPRIWFGRGP